jgi:hypothetical protein
MKKRTNKAELQVMTNAFLGPEPSFPYDHALDPMEYIESLNWYSATLSREESKNYVLSFLRNQKNKTFLKKVQKVPHVHFGPTYGAIARMLSNDILIPSTGPKWLDKNLQTLIEQHTAEEAPEKKKAPVDIQARMNAKARSIAGEIDDIFEDNVWFCKNKLDENHIFNFLHKKNVSGVVAFKVAELLTPHLDELKSIKKDEQLKEAYSQYTSREIKKFIDFYHNVVETCLNYNVNSKKSKVRKPRAKKAVTLDKKLGNFKYLKLYTAFQLASVNPSKVIGANQVWLFDTRYTKLTVLNALDRGGLDVKGQTFLNVDKKSSVTKKVGRKTKEVIESILRSSKPTCRKTLENVTARPGKLQLRTNANILILRTF